jgi:hypothetical protein
LIGAHAPAPQRQPVFTGSRQPHLKQSLTRCSRLEQRGASFTHHFIAPIVRNANSIYLCADGGNLAFARPADRRCVD